MISHNKIILTGTHCSGKTTVINEFKTNPKIQVIDEMIRTLSSIGGVFNFVPDIKNPDVMKTYAFSEMALANFYMSIIHARESLQDDRIWLFDRCLLDVYSYVRYFDIKMDIFDLESKKLVPLKYWIMKNINIACNEGFFDDALIFLLTPIVLDNEDEFRLKGDQCQKDIFDLALITLKTLGLNYQVISSNDASKYIRDNLQ